MGQAWLDSLSEDWVSQHGSAGSPHASTFSPAASTPTAELAPRPADIAPASRIPVYTPHPRSRTTSARPSAPSQNHSPLSERSSNDVNIPLSQRGPRSPSKLRSEVQLDDRGRRLSRSVSASTAPSSLYDTIQHKSTSLSPRKGFQETPEWKRRLLGRDIAYGEQRDLFSPAGLEALFRQPSAAQPVDACISAQYDAIEADSIMPSSPPAGPAADADADATFEHLGPAITKSTERKPAKVTYRLIDDGSSEFSANDLSQSSNFRPVKSIIDSYRRPDGIAPASVHRDATSVPHSKDAATRVASGQSEIFHENLSPIFVAKTSSKDGTVDYTASAVSADELRQRLEGVREVEQGNGGSLHGDQCLKTVALDRRFVSLRRGGYSQDGSFHQRPLSPISDSSVDASAMLPDASVQISTPKQQIRVRKQRDTFGHSLEADERDEEPPKAPHPSPNKSGSPLKLFGDYDTFTNQKLLRRLSQFESAHRELSKSTVKIYEDESDNDDVEIDPEQADASRPTTPTHPPSGRKMSNFGRGDLDNFKNKFSFDTHQTSQAADHDSSSNDATHTEANNTHGFKFDIDQSLIQDRSGPIRAHRRTKTVDTFITTTTTRSIKTAEHNPEVRDTPRKATETTIKRMLRSPERDSVPKRRRTLCEAEMTECTLKSEQNQAKSATEEEVQIIATRKRKDARQGDQQEAANPKVLAMRQILRPRTLTPTHTENSMHEQHLSTAERDRSQEVSDGVKINAERVPRRGPLIGQVKLPMQDESRKGSVTTQDFLDEAKKIMAGIRGKMRPKSSLNSIEDVAPELEDLPKSRHDTIPPEDGSCDDSTREPFSRPPSREGGAVARPPRLQEDPKLLDHLQKYQERAEDDEALAASLKSLAMAKELMESVKELDRIANATLEAQSASQNEVIMSDPPGIRISGNPILTEQHKSMSSRKAGGLEDGRDFLSHGSSSSADQSTSRSIPTGSSRGSDSRRVIAPDSVSHLIPEQLAGMRFDKSTKKWVKQNKQLAEVAVQDFAAFEETDEDPFGDIPDLSVNEAEERVRTINAATHLKGVHIPATHSMDRSLQPRGDDADNEPRETYTPRSSQRDEERAEHDETFDESHVTDDVEREISILEDRVAHHTPQARRNITITFSSPVASFIEAADNDVSPGSTYSEVSAQSNTDRYENVSIKRTVTSNRRPVTASGRIISSTYMRSAMKSATRCISQPLFPMRPVSRIDEKDEDLHTEYTGQMQVKQLDNDQDCHGGDTSELVLATPRRVHEIGTLELTPMSDFTVHQTDERLDLDVSYIQSHRRCASNNSSRTLSLSIRQLIESITEVEAFEPDWVYLKKLVMSGKLLSNLHKLDEFCSGLEELEVTDNAISQLNGAPAGLRRLLIGNNQLNDLAAWGHLRNLQYVDVSGNELESLSAFGSLSHLRTLLANRNKIGSLDGLQHLNGLATLELSGNLLERVDFAGLGHTQIVQLDLRNNRIRDVHNLDALSTLLDLNLENNHITSLEDATCSPHASIKYLRLSNNELTSIDVSNFPDLRLLYLDSNRLGTITGLARTRRLDSFSLREQKTGAALDLRFLQEAFEVRKLYLSGNMLGRFEPQTPFLNLQYLELASCGLTALPSDFGRKMLNLRILNLNFNAIRDITPLIGIVRLKRLFMAGNRIERLRYNTAILARFPGLAQLDFRMNPVTIGFYGPHDTTQDASESLQADAPSRPDVPTPYMLKRADRDADARFTACMDLHTNMLRRIYEIFILIGCPRIKMLDGLAMDRMYLARNDDVHRALVEHGIVSGCWTEQDLRRKDIPRDLRGVDVSGEKGSEEGDVRADGYARGNARDVDSGVEVDSPATVNHHAAGQQNGTETETLEDAEDSEHAEAASPHRHGPQHVETRGLASRAAHPLLADESSRWLAEDSFA